MQRNVSLVVRLKHSTSFWLYPDRDEALRNINSSANCKNKMVKEQVICFLSGIKEETGYITCHFLTDGISGWVRIASNYFFSSFEIVCLEE